MKSAEDSELRLDWNFLFGTWYPPLSAIAPDAIPLTEYCYRFSSCEYASVFNQPNWTSSKQALFVSCFHWAVSLGAFKRLISLRGEDLQDDGILRPLPPVLQCGPDCVTYAQITKYYSTKGDRFRLNELHDENGHFLGSCITMSSRTYWFRSPQPVPANEMPFAFTFDTNKKLMGFAGGTPGDTCGHLWTPQKKIV